MTKSREVLQTVDEPARRLGKSLLRAARHAALATLAPGEGGPLASRVLVASDPAGHPLLLVSRLSAHTAALLDDPRCSLLFGETAEGDPLAQPRISVQGHAEALDGDGRLRARQRFLARHPGAEAYCDFGDFLFLRIRIQGANLIGGFARAYRLAESDLLDATSDEMEERLSRAIAHMNEDHSDAVDAIAASHAGSDGSGWAIVTADRSGFEIARETILRRVAFERAIETPQDIRTSFVALAGSSA